MKKFNLEKKLVSISEAASMLGVHPNTLRNWEKQGYIQVDRTTGGKRRYNIEDLKKILGDDQNGL